jgi:hypothetical protein
MHSPKNSCSKGVDVLRLFSVAEHLICQHCPTPGMFAVANTSCVSGILPVCVLSYSLLPCQDKHCWMLHEQQQTISMGSNVREWTRVPFVNTPCSYLHSFCATGVSSGIARRVTLTKGHGGCWESVTRRWTCSFRFVPSWLLTGCILNYTIWPIGLSRFDPQRADFSSSTCVQTGSGAHPASYPMGTGGSFPGG